MFFLFQTTESQQGKVKAQNNDRRREPIPLLLWPVLWLSQELNWTRIKVTTTRTKTPRKAWTQKQTKRRKATSSWTWTMKVLKRISLTTLLKRLTKSSFLCLSNNMESINYNQLDKDSRLKLFIVSWFSDFQRRPSCHQAVAIKFMCGVQLLFFPLFSILCMIKPTGKAIYTRQTNTR